MAAKMEHIVRFNRIRTNIAVLRAAVEGISLHDVNVSDPLYSLTDFTKMIFDDIHELAKDVAELEEQLNKERDCEK